MLYKFIWSWAYVKVINLLNTRLDSHVFYLVQANEVLSYVFGYICVYNSCIYMHICVTIYISSVLFLKKHVADL